MEDFLKDTYSIITRNIHKHKFLHGLTDIYERLSNR